jgi:glycosyltransferase involved in cell wall biosynthesis
MEVAGFSIVICCYNSEKRISETLKYAFDLSTNEFIKYEIILINNNSTDSTVLQAELANNRFNNKFIPFSIINEFEPGLTKARLKGLSEARFEWIIFCDDDNLLDKNYLIAVAKIITSFSSVGIIGGWCRPKLPFFPGKWIESNYAALACEAKPGHQRLVQWVFGAGMVLKKRVIKDLDKREIKVLLPDRVGTMHISGGDAELCQLTTFIGYQVVYSPDLILDHAISPDRLSRWSFIRRNFGNVYEVVFAFLLQISLNNRDCSLNSIYWSYFKKIFLNIFYFAPRALFGKNKFYSFMMFYQNIQLFFWLITGKHKMANIYKSIKFNLYKK